MTVRELIKQLETCDLDQNVAIIMSIVEESEDGYNVMLREITGVVENSNIVGIQ